MADVACWSLFAFMDGDPDGTNDERRVLADWQVDHVVDWCVRRGFDNIYLARLPETTRYERKPVPAELIRHHAP